MWRSLPALAAWLGRSCSAAQPWFLLVSWLTTVEPSCSNISRLSFRHCRDLAAGYLTGFSDGMVWWILGDPSIHFSFVLLPCYKTEDIINLHPLHQALSQQTQPYHSQQIRPETPNSDQWVCHCASTTRKLPPFLGSNHHQSNKLTTPHSQDVP